MSGTILIVELSPGNFMAALHTVLTGQVHISGTGLIRVMHYSTLLLLYLSSHEW